MPNTCVVCHGKHYRTILKKSLCSKCKNAFFTGWTKLANRATGSWQLMRNTSLLGDVEIGRISSEIFDYLNMFSKCIDSRWNVDLRTMKPRGADSLCNKCRFRVLLISEMDGMPKSIGDLFSDKYVFCVEKNLPKIISELKTRFRDVRDTVFCADLTRVLDENTNLPAKTTEMEVFDPKQQTCRENPKIYQVRTSQIKDRNTRTQLFFNTCFTHFSTDAGKNYLVKTSATNQSTSANYMLAPPELSEFDYRDSFSGVFYLTALHALLKKHYLDAKGHVLHRGLKFVKSSWEKSDLIKFFF